MGAITVTQLGKAYHQYPTKWSRLLEWFVPRDKPRHNLKWVLQDINFHVSPGEAIGIIGINGAGKSTLLKLITGTTHPTTGSVKMGGRVAALLELGMGFHPDFTGRQNALMAGQLLGLQAYEIDLLMPEIESFAEIGDYIDQPVRVYSSGMQVRLAFAVATAVRPDILIVDEALSVGDSYFQHKSFDRIRQFRANGVSILFVTHSMSDVRTLCDRVILLDKGRVLKDGQPDEVVDYYNALIAEKENAKLTIEQRREKNGWLVTQSGTGEAQITSMTLHDAATGQELAIAQVGQQVQLRLKATAVKDLSQLVVGLMIRDKQGHVIWGTNTWHTHQVLQDIQKSQCISLSASFSCILGHGSYSVTAALTSSESHVTDNFEWIDNLLVFDVINVDKPVFIGSTWLDATLFLEQCS